MRYALLGLSLLAATLSGLSARSRPGWDWGAGVPAPRVPADNPMSAAKVELGRRLFYDADLSVNGTMSCATCHEQHHAFADGNRTHPGALDDPGRRNVPALVNLAWLSPLTWADPRQTTLEAQVSVPVLGDHPVEMGMKGREADIAERLGRDPCYRTMFRKAFPGEAGGIGYGKVTKALAAFERTLVSRDSAWDKFSRGEADAISAEARQGATFFARDCASCHAGADFTDARFHRITAPGEIPGDDAGLAEVTGVAADRGGFRTPGLRNVGVTAPYLHDGSIPTLAGALRAHAGFEAMPQDEAKPLLAFLDALTDPAFLADRRHALPRTACGKAL
ncbi:cytochrome c peroxidase [Novosphingobium sp. ST904]|uniref:cytochrome c peroxidase n=1 Tax=Novosphingobium sp. ST904 TaxID=1684385 RepID=UPI0006C8997F|nr:cytochrome c peroxidase [Novosphingobium sp. ST904]KPH67070.1 cytochrome C peroxidase [Novosphingobium sp. ST904]TCM25164.1 cytochrome c peroxidase [Novosphingobium sp. ST904]